MTTQSAVAAGGVRTAPAEDAAGMTGMQKMASRMWAPWTVMGLMMVVISFVIALVVSNIEAGWFEASKAAREAAAAGSSLAVDKGVIEATKAWVPGFKFLGLGFMLGGITFLLATILGNLRVGGGNVQRALGVPVVLPDPPMTAKLFPMLMMMGMMILIAAFGVSIWLGINSANYWDHSIMNELNPAGEGSSLLRDLGRIQATKTWLTPLKFVGMAFMFSGIALALVTIVTVLRAQTSRIVEIASGNR